MLIVQSTSLPEMPMRKVPPWRISFEPLPVPRSWVMKPRYSLVSASARRPRQYVMPAAQSSEPWRGRGQGGSGAIRSMSGSRRSRSWKLRAKAGQCRLFGQWIIM